MFTEINKSLVPPPILQKVTFFKSFHASSDRRLLKSPHVWCGRVRSRVSQDTRYLAEGKANTSKLSWRLNCRSWSSAHMAARIYLWLVVEFPEKSAASVSWRWSFFWNVYKYPHYKNYGFSTIALLVYTIRTSARSFVL